MQLNKYLQNKPIFYKKIDYTRMPRAYKSIKDKLPKKEIIHIVGTNGKGSTGRFLTLHLEALGYKVGHFTSPHIFKFNERFYLNGKDASDEELELAHEYLFSILNDEFRETLSYFEYATFLAIILFKNCDYIILEAGMGAEYDSTNLFPKKLSVFTPIGLDHTEILGDTIEKISKTKLISMAKNSVVNSDMNEVSKNIARDIAIKNSVNLKFSNEVLDEFDKKEINNYVKKFDLPKFQISNLSLATAALKMLNLQPNYKNLKKLNLKGRLEKILPNLTIDVGHNDLAATNILNEFSGKKIVLIYNSFLDKDYKKILRDLMPIIKRVEIYEYESKDRKLATKEIIDELKLLGIKCSKFTKIENSENYLLFGSFMLVENFLKNEVEN
ncbi:bifunctional folypolyglutamate synthetase / dihydrofolate synthetase [Campylobacter blaseri]|uniref:Bifunctional folylpolyglutamate synthase/dihydrofolate synthase n=1 Tax=Campylobacter blaseri TaxID=2042961 RepID=A0A2P8R1Z4_9BACT|nr:Mur ligase family protein [Campylobacter blaseri]PSM52511.1 bifunctional folylpolyglutamate synthase/dihydrofolate synthase [Campylobacter blaseri]PSM54159.1 bifunctional folylpolyglutamate synthase/dihydrofolate synthase [Campylobacter blaseri]QKF85807.1 bifunctional folypolyglutamate synthetase / dihydrofolate synthetase [Campylobacter blaseri]